MLVLLPVIVALVGAAAFAAISVLLLRSRRPGTSKASVPATAIGEARGLVGSAQLRMVISVVIGLVVTIVVLSLPLDHVQTALAVAPALGGAATLIVVAVSPFRRRSSDNGLRRADLTPRTIATFGPRWGFILPVVGAVLLVILLVATGVTSSPDYLGRLRVFRIQVPGGYQASSPYPGWYYALPILISVAVLVAALLVALRRITGAPRMGTAGGQPLDSLLRVSLTRFVMLVGAAVIVLYLGAITLTASAAMRGASEWQHYTAAAVRAMEAQVKTHGSATLTGTAANMVHGVVQPSYTTGAIGSLVGILLIGFAIVLALLALTSLVIRWSVVAEAETEKVDA